MLYIHAQTDGYYQVFEVHYSKLLLNANYFSNA